MSTIMPQVLVPSDQLCKMLDKRRDTIDTLQHKIMMQELELKTLRAQVMELEKDKQKRKQVWDMHQDAKRIRRIPSYRHLPCHHTVSSPPTINSPEYTPMPYGPDSPKSSEYLPTDPIAPEHREGTSDEDGAIAEIEEFLATL
jgi:hypothetical protein